MIFDDDGRLGRSLGDGNNAQSSCRSSRRAALLLNFEPYLVGLVDVRGDFDLVAHVFARGVEPQPAQGRQATGGTSSARHLRKRPQAAPHIGLQGNVFAHVDLGGNVVSGDDVRGGKNVSPSRARQRIHHNAKGRNADTWQQLIVRS